MNGEELYVELFRVHVLCYTSVNLYTVRMVLLGIYIPVQCSLKNCIFFKFLYDNYMQSLVINLETFYV